MRNIFAFVVLTLLFIQQTPSFAQDKEIIQLRKELKEARPEDRNEAKFSLAAKYYRAERPEYKKYRAGIAAEKTADSRLIIQLLDIYELKVQKKNEEGLAKVNKLLGTGISKPYFLKSAYVFKSDFIANLQGFEAANKVLRDALVKLRPYKKNAYLADVYNRIGNNYYALGNYKLSKTACIKAAELTPDYKVEQKCGRLMNVGVLFYRTGETETSISYYNKALKKVGDYNVVKGNLYINRAMSYERLTQPDTALADYMRAEKAFKIEQDTALIITALESRVRVLNTLNRSDEALEALLTVIRFYKKSGDEEGLINTYRNVADFYLDAHDTATAFNYLDQSIFIARKLKLNPRIVSSLGAKATLLREMRRYDESVKLLLESEQIAIKSEDEVALGSIYLGLGNTYKSNNKLDLSLKNYQKALTIFLKINDREGIAGLYSNIGVIYYDQKKYDLALVNYRNALEIRRKLGNKKHLYDTYETLANVYAAKGDYKSGYDYLWLHTKLKDSVNYQEVNDKVLALQTEFQTEQIQDSLLLNKQELKVSQADQQLQKAENSRNMLIIIGMAIVLLLIIGLLMLIARNSRQRKAANLKLQQQNAEIEEQKGVIEEKNKDIIDSISYAKRLQEAILPPAKLVKYWLPQSFILYKPKDIVAGDFYWMETVETNGETIILYAAADCTGHGVPGAMISVVCSNALNRAVKEFAIYQPAAILDKVTDLVVETFEKSENQVKDGMDISLCALNLNRMELSWAGANNPLWIINGSSFREIKGDKQPIGPFEYRKSFTNHEISLTPGDTIYTFSDGYADQFGGPNGKKLKSSAFREMLLKAQDLGMDDQRVFLNDSFNNWKGAIEQLDDVCVIGMRI